MFHRHCAMLVLLAPFTPLSSAQEDANPRARAVLSLAPAPRAPAGSSSLVLSGFDDRDAWAEAAGCAPTKVDFDDIADGTQITTDLQGLGIGLVSGESPFEPGATTQFVTSSASLPFPMFVAGNLPSEPNFLSNRLTSGVFATGSLRFDFDAPTLAVGAFIADSSPLDGFQIEVFDGDGSLGTITVGPRTLPSSFVGVVSDVPFIAARFVSVSMFDSWGLDDLEFCGLAAACFTLDFQTEDDFETPLVNGQHIDTEFGSLALFSSSGPNAGLGIFDSTLGGPNDPSQDRDLLVGSGNILILQTENFPPDGNDVFPRPNDDEDGGVITVELVEPLEAMSVRLIDVDATDGAHFVVLTDSSARQRTYTVPANWTGDILVAGPGTGLLDLMGLAPQPGFGSVATAVEDGGFDATSLVRIDFDLNGSAGIDDLTLCVPGVVRASAHLRAGSGVNPMNLTPASRPILGQTWTADLDCSAVGPGVALLVVRHSPSTGSMTPFGEVLIQGAMMHQATLPQAGTVRQLTWDIPFALSLIGTEVHAQGLCTGSLTGPGAKRLQIRGRLSNAVDLILGF